jgi:O-antigen ligase
MSIRIAALTLVIAGLAIYAWRDWFMALCGLILLMAVVEHPDMPKTLLGVQGLNPWNVLLFVVVCAWAVNRSREGLTWDMPAGTSLLLTLYLVVVLVGFGRMMSDRSELTGITTGYLVSENLINCIKWVIPGLLLFDGCRTRRRLLQGLACVLGVYVLLALQVIRWMPLETVLSGDDLTARSRKILMNEVGYHAVNMSMLLAGASWAVLATMPLLQRFSHKVLIVLAALIILYGQVLTAGRMGYVTWALVGLVLCTIRWRKLLPLLAVAPLAVAVLLPGAMDRVLLGFGETDVSGQEVTDNYLVTSGRTLVWPLVLEEIGEAPLVGYGRKAMITTGLAREIQAQYGDSFPHPHNAYLEWLLDNGVTGLAVVMPFFLLMMARSARLLLDPGHELFAVCGGVACALILALLVAGLGSQTFYPREGAVGMWCAIGLMMRVWVERRQRAAVAAGSMAARFQFGFAGAAAPAIPRRGETPLDPLRS